MEGTWARIAAYKVAAILAHFTIVVVVILHHGTRHIDCDILHILLLAPMPALCPRSLFVASTCLIIGLLVFGTLL